MNALQRNLTDDEVDAFMRLANDHPHPIPLACHLMLYCGLRLGETLALRWSDLVTGLYARHAVEISTKRSKTRDSRAIPIPAGLQTYISQLWDRARTTWQHSYDTHVCTTTCMRTAVTPRLIQRHVIEIGHQTCRRRVTPHMLRHTFATRLARTTPLHILQQLLGHARLNTTSVYLHGAAADLLTAIETGPQPTLPRQQKVTNIT